MNGNLRALAEEYVALTEEIDGVRREMLACLTNGGGANPIRPTSAPRRGEPASQHPKAAKIDQKVLDLLKATPGLKVGEPAKATSSKTSTTRERLRRMRARHLVAPVDGGGWSACLPRRPDRWGDRRASPAPIACAPWPTPLYASTARDVAGRSTLDNRTKAQKVAAFHDNRVRAQETARRNGSNAW